MFASYIQYTYIHTYIHTHIQHGVLYYHPAQFYTYSTHMYTTTKLQEVHYEITFFFPHLKKNFFFNKNTQKNCLYTLKRAGIFQKLQRMTCMCTNHRSLLNCVLLMFAIYHSYALVLHVFVHNYRCTSSCSVQACVYNTSAGALIIAF